MARARFTWCPRANEREIISHWRMRRALAAAAYQVKVVFSSCILMRGNWRRHCTHARMRPANTIMLCAARRCCWWRRSPCVYNRFSYIYDGSKKRSALSGQTNHATRAPGPRDSPHFVKRYAGEQKWTRDDFHFGFSFTIKLSLYLNGSHS